MADGRSSRRGERRPTSAEIDLWRAMTRDVTPLHGEDGGESLWAADEPDRTPARDDRPTANGKTETQPAPRRAPAKHDQPAAAPRLSVGNLHGIDRRTADRLRRGRLPIEARLDLHGMTRADAESALAGFIQRAAGRGMRCVLVITGKGRATGESVLRNDLPRWLNNPAVRPSVLACVPAQQRHGGHGAFYVLLRRQRT